MNLRTLLKIRSDQDVYESVNIDRAAVYTHLVFELVGILVFFLVEVDEVVRDAFLGPGVHIPADLKGVACDVADFYVLGNRKFLHLGNAAVQGLIS